MTGREKAQAVQAALNVRGHLHETWGPLGPLAQDLQNRQQLTACGLPFHYDDYGLGWDQITCRTCVAAALRGRGQGEQHLLTTAARLGL